MHDIDLEKIYREKGVGVAKKIINITVDAVMFVLFLLLMEFHLLPRATHEWLGLSVFVLFLAHNALNCKWYAVLFKGRYTAMRIVQTVVTFLLWAAMICCIVSAVLISGTVFAWMNVSGAMAGRSLHMIATSWTFMLMSAHLGLHGAMFVGMAKRIKISAPAATIITWILRIVVLGIGIYGAVVFAQRAFYEELFLLTEFKQFNYDISAFAYFLQTAALSVLFVSATYYLKKLFLFIKKRR